MQIHFFCSAILVACLLVSSSFAAEPKAVALDAIASLYINNDLVGFQDFLDDDAVQGDGKPGSAATKLGKQTPEMLKSATLGQIIFFEKDDIDRLSTSYPDDLWSRVRSHIGDRQGVLVKLELTGKLAERAEAAGKDPRDLAMMTFIVDDTEDPKIVHVDDN